MEIWDWFVSFWTGPVKVWHMIAFVMVPLAITLIPSPIDQNPWAHWRNPMDMMRQG